MFWDQSSSLLSHWCLSKQWMKPFCRQCCSSEVKVWYGKGPECHNDPVSRRVPSCNTRLHNHKAFLTFLRPGKQRSHCAHTSNEGIYHLFWQVHGSATLVNFTVSPETTGICYDALFAWGGLLGLISLQHTAVSWQPPKHALLIQLTLTSHIHTFLQKHEAPLMATFQCRNCRLKVNIYIFPCVKDQEHPLSSKLCNFVR